jgi:prepilin-type N-terminal cleavage/methylation domain-containing protein
VKTSKRSTGFTLIELLVVIAIIGILAALVLVSLGNAREKAHSAQVRSSISQIRTLAEIYYSSNFFSYMGLDTCLSTPNSTNCVGGIEDEVISLRAALTEAHLGGAAHVLETRSDDDDFCVSSALPPDSTVHVCIDASGVMVEGTSQECILGAPLPMICP